MLKMGLGLNKSQHSFNLRSIPGLQLLELPNRDLATGWTSDIKVVQDYSQGGKQYGSELVVNGGFDTDSDWLNTGVNWIIEDGVAKKVTTTSVSLYQEILEVGKYYRLELDNIVDGKVVYLYNGSARSLGSAAGRKFIEFQALQTQLYITFLTESGGQIDNVSVKEITNGNHGIYRNSMELNQLAGRTFYRFDATDDYISHGNPTALQVTNNFTIGVILKTSSDAASNPVISKYEFGTDNRSWMIQMASGDMKFYESSDGTSANTRVSGLNGTTNYDDAVARMFTFTKESNNVRGYVNATPGTVAWESGALTVNSCYNSSANLAVGTRFNNTVASGFFSGDIGLYFICNKVLTAGQISQIYNSAEVQRILRGM